MEKLPHSVQAAIEQFSLPHPSGDGRVEISVYRVPAARRLVGQVPVLFVLDADLEFALAAEIARFRASTGRLAAAMVVGIGYGLEHGDLAKRRRADLTPELTVGADALPWAGLAEGENGGAARLLRFLTGTLLPAIALRYPEASPSQRFLFGHSLGGLFVAYALIEQPEAFSDFLIGSPALWWNAFDLIARTAELEHRIAASSRPPRVFICVGELERALPTTVPDTIDATLDELQSVVRRARVVDAALQFGEALGGIGLQEVKCAVIPEEEHLTVVPAALMRGLSFAMKS